MAMKTLRATGHMGAGMTIEIMCGEHKVYMDQPKNAGGADLGPAPPELILAAYAGCVGSIGRIIAFQEKITLRGMTFAVEADYDPDCLLGRETSARAGWWSVSGSTSSSRRSSWAACSWPLPRACRAVKTPLGC